MAGWLPRNGARRGKEGVEAFLVTQVVRVQALVVSLGFPASPRGWVEGEDGWKEKTGGRRGRAGEVPRCRKGPLTSFRDDSCRIDSRDGMLRLMEGWDRPSSHSAVWKDGKKAIYRGPALDQPQDDPAS